MKEISNILLLSWAFMSFALVSGIIYLIYAAHAYEKEQKEAERREAEERNKSFKDNYFGDKL